MKTRVSIKMANGDVLQEVVQTVYLNKSRRTLTLHYDAAEPICRIFELSINNKLELYKYTHDGHIGVTVPLEQIFCIEYINDK